MDNMKVRQICFYFIAMMPVVRFLVYPATLSYNSSNDLLFSAFINLLLEGAAVALVMLLAKKTKLSLFELIENTFGRIAAKIVYALFALFFLAAALLPMMEQKNFVLLVMYENVPSVISFAPFFFVCLFACVKGFKSIGRMADIALPVFAIAFVALILLALPQTDFSALLPIAGVPIKDVLKGSLFSANWYTEAAFLLFSSELRIREAGSVESYILIRDRKRRGAPFSCRILRRFFGYRHPPIQRGRADIKIHHFVYLAGQGGLSVHLCARARDDLPPVRARPNVRALHMQGDRL